MKKLLLVFCLLASVVSRPMAQDLYEVQFTDGFGVKYLGLLVLFNDTKMYMRVAYNWGEKYNVVNVEYTSEHGTYQGTEYLVLVGSNPVFITDKDNFSYNPDHLIFTDVTDVPWITDNPDDPEKMQAVDAFRPLNGTNITDSYLRQFYASEESDYKALKRMFGIGGTTTPPTYEERNTGKPATLHLIVIANTDIGDIGSGCAVDQRNLESEFSGIANALGIGYRKHIVNGQQFTKPNVMNMLNNLSVGSNDVVVCVYRGHGFRWSNQEEVWPMMDMRVSSYTRLSENTTIGLSEVYQHVVNKGARLNIILGDCCNNDIGLSQVTSNNFLVMQNNNQYDPQKLKRLFLDAKGNLLSCAASPGEYSWVNSANGGFYTTSFLQSLREEISYLKNDQADWKDLINNTLIGANAKIKSCSNCTPQNGKYYYGISDN